jgi:catechol 2,3-dioxygenase-like lactoylglutathione lyase family enzyme
MNGCHVGLLSFRAEEMIRFYVDQLGFTEGESRLLSRELMETIFSLPGECRMTKLQRENLTLEVFSPQGLEPQQGAGSYAVGFNHFALNTGDKQRFCRDLEAKGVPVIECAYKDRFVYFVVDPDGNRIEIFD